MTRIALLLGAVLLLFPGLEHPFARAQPHKKFIQLGWDIPSTVQLREHWQEMEQTTPFDGVMFRLEVQDDQGRPLSSQSIWDARPWRRDWLKPALEDLQACRFQRFRDNFVRFNATPGTLAWDDDPGWAALAEKAGHCAWLMKQAGCKGLAIDFESYGAAQFQFDPARDRTFAEATRRARRRGAQFVRAVAQEFPDAVLLGLWLNSIHFQAGRSTRPESILVSSHYGLLPAFIDGMLDALPPDMILVDGCENGYYMDSAETYLRASHEMRSWQGACVRLVSPENRVKYRQQVQAGFGFYLDMYLNPEGNRYYFPPLDGSRLARLERNLGFAREAADQYVWIYGEQCRWWGLRGENCQTRWGRDGCGKKPCRGSHGRLLTYAIQRRQPRASWPNFAKLASSRIWPEIPSSVSPHVRCQDRCRLASEPGRTRRLPRGNSPGTRRSGRARGEPRKCCGAAFSRAWK
jgi:hypothetical protein